MTDLERYYSSFIEEMEDYKEMLNENLTKTDYILKHIYPWMQEQIDKEYNEYLWRQSNGDKWEVLDKDEWIEEVYEIENEDDLQDMIYDDNNPLNIETYVNTRNEDDKKIEIALTLWWPNIILYIDTRRESVMYWWYWWTDQVEKYCNYLYNTIMNRYSLDY